MACVVRWPAHWCGAPCPSGLAVPRAAYEDRCPPRSSGRTRWLRPSPTPREGHPDCTATCAPALSIQQILVTGKDRDPEGPRAGQGRDRATARPWDLRRCEKATCGGEGVTQVPRPRTRAESGGTGGQDVPRAPPGGRGEEPAAQHEPAALPVPGGLNLAGVARTRGPSQGTTFAGPGARAWGRGQSCLSPQAPRQLILTIRPWGGAAARSMGPRASRAAWFSAGWSLTTSVLTGSRTQLLGIPKPQQMLPTKQDFGPRFQIEKNASNWKPVHVWQEREIVQPLEDRMEVPQEIKIQSGTRPSSSAPGYTDHPKEPKAGSFFLFGHPEAYGVPGLGSDPSCS